MDKKIKVAVIGGGIAGLALTTQLVKNQNLDVNILQNIEVKPSENEKYIIKAR